MWSLGGGVTVWSLGGGVTVWSLGGGLTVRSLGGGLTVWKNLLYGALVAIGSDSSTGSPTPASFLALSLK